MTEVEKVLTERSEANLRDLALAFEQYKMDMTRVETALVDRIIKLERLVMP